MSSTHNDAANPGALGEGVPEDDVLQIKWVLYYTRGGNTDPQHILLGGNIALCSHTVYITKVTGNKHEHFG